MAKPKSKKAPKKAPKESAKPKRSPAQIAATKKMLAANKAAKKSGGAKKPAKKRAPKSGGASKGLASRVGQLEADVEMIAGHTEKLHKKVGEHGRRLDNQETVLNFMLDKGASVFGGAKSSAARSPAKPAGSSSAWAN